MSQKIRFLSQNKLIICFRFIFRSVHLDSFVRIDEKKKDDLMNQFAKGKDVICIKNIWLMCSVYDYKILQLKIGVYTLFFQGWMRLYEGTVSK